MFFKVCENKNLARHDKTTHVYFAHNCCIHLGFAFLYGIILLELPCLFFYLQKVSSSSSPSLILTSDEIYYFKTMADINIWRRKIHSNSRSFSSPLNEFQSDRSTSSSWSNHTQDKPKSRLGSILSSSYTSSTSSFASSFSHDLWAFAPPARIQEDPIQICNEVMIKIMSNPYKGLGPQYNNLMMKIIEAYGKLNKHLGGFKGNEALLEYSNLDRDRWRALVELMAHSCTPYQKVLLRRKANMIFDPSDDGVALDDINHFLNDSEPEDHQHISDSQVERPLSENKTRSVTDPCKNKTYKSTSVRLNSLKSTNSIRSEPSNVKVHSKDATSRSSAWRLKNFTFGTSSPKKVSELSRHTRVFSFDAGADTIHSKSFSKKVIKPKRITPIALNPANTTQAEISIPPVEAFKSRNQRSQIFSPSISLRKTSIGSSKSRIPSPAYDSTTMISRRRRHASSSSSRGTVIHRSSETEATCNSQDAIEILRYQRDSISTARSISSSKAGHRSIKSEGFADVSTTKRSVVRHDSGKFMMSANGNNIAAEGNEL